MAITRKNIVKSKSQQNEEKRKKERIVDEPDSWKYYIRIFHYQLLRQSTVLYLQLPSHSSREMATWAATLAPN